MTAKIIQLRVVSKSVRPNGQAYIQRLLPKLLGLLMTRGKPSEDGFYVFQREGIEIEGRARVAQPFRVQVRYQKAIAFRCYIRDRPFRGASAQFSGRVRVTIQHRGPWEGLVERFRGREVSPSQCVREWIF